MRAISVHETGEPDVLRLSAAPEPIAGPGELLVHTHATGLNFIETYQRAGVYPLPLPFTPGAEASGTVLAVGAGVTRFAPGDRICTAEGHATYAERFVVRADRVARVPEGVSVVYDGVGRDTFDGSLEALRVRGTLALVGGASGQVPPVDPQQLNAGGSLSLTRPTLAHFLATPEERAWRYHELFSAVRSGALDVRIGARFPLADAGLAHAALEGRRTTGKVLLDPGA